MGPDRAGDQGRGRAHRRADRRAVGGHHRHRQGDRQAEGLQPNPAGHRRRVGQHLALDAHGGAGRAPAPGHLRGHQQPAQQRRGVHAEMGHRGRPGRGPGGGWRPVGDIQPGERSRRHTARQPGHGAAARRAAGVRDELLEDVRRQVRPGQPVEHQERPGPPVGADLDGAEPQRQHRRPGTPGAPAREADLRGGRPVPGVCPGARLARGVHRGGLAAPALDDGAGDRGQPADGRAGPPAHAGIGCALAALAGSRHAIRAGQQRHPDRVPRRAVAPGARNREAVGCLHGGGEDRHVDGGDADCDHRARHRDPRCRRLHQQQRIPGRHQEIRRRRGVRLASHFAGGCVDQQLQLGRRDGRDGRRPSRRALHAPRGRARHSRQPDRRIRRSC